MSPVLVLVCVGLATALALISLGGGLYEFSVVDPCWPQRPDIVQPKLGGLNRKVFWITAHVTFELALIAALVTAWRHEPVRALLLVGAASHVVMRLWSAVDFIPKALAFERMAPDRIDAEAAARWTRRSRWRFPLDLVTCGALLGALLQLGRVLATTL